MTKSSSPRLWRLALVLFGMIALRSLAVVPLRNILSADIAYAESVLPLVLNIFSDLLQLAAIFVSYAAVIGAVFRGGLRAAMPAALIYLLASLFGACANLVIDLVFHAGGEVFVALLAISLLGVLFEMLQLMLVLFGTRLLARRYAGPLVPTSLFSLRVRPQLAAFLSAMLVLVVQAGGRLLYDVSYGAPTSASEVAEMVTGYGGDLLTAFLGYCGMTLILMSGRERTETE